MFAQPIIPLRRVSQERLTTRSWEIGGAINQNLKFQGPLPDPGNPDEMEVILKALAERDGDRDGR